MKHEKGTLLGDRGGEERERRGDSVREDRSRKIESRKIRV